MTVPLQQVLDELQPDERARVDALIENLMAEQLTLAELRDNDGNIIPHSRVVDLRDPAVRYICALRRTVERRSGTLSVAIDYPGLPTTEFPAHDDDSPED